MKLLVLPLLVAASSLCAQTTKTAATPSKEVVQYLAQVQQIIRKKALYADSIDWSRLRKEVGVKSQGLTTVADCQPVLDHIMRTLRQAGDKHSFFLSTDKATNWTSTSYAGQQAESRYLGEGIGYVKVPAFSSMNATAGQTFSEDIQRQITALQTQHPVTGWVLDLRHNTGGNMRPMIQGIQSLLGEGVYGYFIFPRSTFQRQLPLYSWSGQKKQLPARAIPAEPKRIAVLIDSMTGSSGEMVAIALKGLGHVKFFGQPSAGYTTTNGTYQLSDGAYLLLATGYMADRNRHTYLPNIIPDVVVEQTAAEAPDKTIEAASSWLREGK
ncbi:S41 family peptidase [Hymenobacter sp. UYP22]|uniref:S41 family peptidase n=1 Tax=Hymenobacter sp. UYP22 TaxID=3156348 RepID=UPI0033977FA5